jgi:hypothetical protein
VYAFTPYFCYIKPSDTHLLLTSGCSLFPLPLRLQIRRYTRLHLHSSSRFVDEGLEHSEDGSEPIVYVVIGASSSAYDPSRAENEQYYRRLWWSQDQAGENGALVGGALAKAVVNAILRQRNQVIGYTKARHVRKQDMYESKTKAVRKQDMYESKTKARQMQDKTKANQVNGGVGRKFDMSNYILDNTGHDARIAHWICGPQ